MFDLLLRFYGWRPVSTFTPAGHPVLCYRHALAPAVELRFQARQG